MIPKKAQEILDFWFKETPSEKRFKKDNGFDQIIRDKFLKPSDKEISANPRSRSAILRIAEKVC